MDGGGKGVRRQARRVDKDGLIPDEDMAVYEGLGKELMRLSCALMSRGCLTMW